MTAVRGMGPLPARVEASEGGRSLRRLFGKLGLPVDLAARPDRRILLRDMIALFADAADFVGDPLFGFHVGAAMSPTDFGSWARYALAADTLEGCLQRASRSLRYHQTGAALTLTSDGAFSRYTYRLNAPGGLDHRQHGDHVLPALLRSIGRYAGPGWRPSWIEVKSLHGRGLDLLQDVVDCEVRPKAEALAIVFPTALLENRAPDPLAAATTPWRSLRQLVREAPPRTVSDTVVEIAYARLFDRRFDLDGIAGKLNVGVRTLQRRLERDGRGYRAILGQVRHLHASDLLRETDLPVTEIAWALGYEDPAHFARAFRRTAGMSPSGYRRATRARSAPG
jgi:AraC-like DNA-binding protein